MNAKQEMNAGITLDTQLLQSTRLRQAVLKRALRGGWFETEEP